MQSTNYILWYFKVFYVFTLTTYPIYREGQVYCKRAKGCHISQILISFRHIFYFIELKFIDFKYCHTWEQKIVDKTLKKKKIKPLPIEKNIVCMNIFLARDIFLTLFMTFILARDSEKVATLAM